VQNLARRGSLQAGSIREKKRDEQNHVRSSVLQLGTET
jgi:hypothetical protein